MVSSGRQASADVLAMSRSLLAAACLLPLGLGAQQRGAAPATEVGAVFTACEAFAFARCQQIAVQMQGLGSGTSTHDVPGYRAFGGEVPWHSTSADARRPAMVPLVYLVPAVDDGSAVRVFCIRGDGAIAWTDNAAGTGLSNGRLPEVSDALGEGGPAVAANFPRSPSKGRDGNLWLPAESARRSRVALRVADEDGKPLGVAVVALEPVGEGLGLDVALPAGVSRTFHEGDAVIDGVLARGLGVVIEQEGVRLPIEPALVTTGGGAVRITVPRGRLLALRVQKNEQAAIATLRNIASAQAQCRAAGAIDADGDGTAEYGTLAELAGAVVVRGGDQRITPPLLAAAFRRIEHGVVVRSGYCFRVWLPGKAGAPVGEAPGGGLAAVDVDASLAARHWCAYAWPVEAGVTGQRVFFIDQAGDVLAAPNADGRCSGASGPPAPGAARAQGAGETLDAAPAANAVGSDGQRWVVSG
jgi:hypothetical protein